MGTTEISPIFGLFYIVITPHNKFVRPSGCPSKHFGFRGYITVKGTKENNRFIP
jgi:hypothetical protein